MAIAVDGSSPARWAGATASGTGTTSASFTAPTDALLVACVSFDGDAATFGTFTYAFSDSGGLTWTQRVARTNAETTDGGASMIYTARTTSSVSRTATFTPTWTGNPSFLLRRSVKLYALTGVDVDGTPVDTVTASNEGGSATNNLTTTSITPGANGLLIACDTDWFTLGVFTSSDLTIDTADYAGAISVCSGYKTCTSGVGVTANLNAGGTATAQHKWTQIVVREAGGAATKAMPVFRRRTRFFTVRG
jgi:hypothetical protein